MAQPRFSKQPLLCCMQASTTHQAIQAIGVVLGLATCLRVGVEHRPHELGVVQQRLFSRIAAGRPVRQATAKQNEYCVDAIAHARLGAACVLNQQAPVGMPARQ